MIKHLVAFISFLFLSSAFITSPSNPSTHAQEQLYEVIVVDRNLSPDEEAMVRNASFEINYDSDGIIRTQVIKETDFNIAFNVIPGEKTGAVWVKVFNDTDNYVKFIDSIIQGDILGYYESEFYDIPTVMLVRDRMDTMDEYQSVVSHELAHSWGMWHDYHQGTLMYPMENGSASCLTYADMEEFCVKYDCRGANIHYCNALPICF